MKKIRPYMIKRFLHWKYGLLRSDFRMKKIDEKPVPKSHDEIRVFAMLRNESLRLPYFLHYYKKLGVDRFIFIDNGSTDDSPEIILNDDQSHLFCTDEIFKHYGNWNEILFNKYGVGNWCVAVDLDEFITYPHIEHIDLKKLCKALDERQYNALPCFLLDMYSDKPFIENKYTRGDDPLKTCSYFDADYHTEERTLLNPKKMKQYRAVRISGNMRKRVFELDENLSKVPLIKYSKNMYLADGRHYIDGAKCSDIRGAVLHMKYLQDFNERVIEEEKRGVHADGAISYQYYAAKVRDDKAVTAFSSESTKYQNSRSLLDCGIMKTSTWLEQKIGDH